MTTREARPRGPAIVPAIGPSRGRKAYRYALLECLTPAGDRWGIARYLSGSAEHYCWNGRRRGWNLLTGDNPPKFYARRGDALATLRKLQAEDREAMTAAGRRRKLERYAPELLEALRDTLGALDDAEAMFPPIRYEAAIKARHLLAILARG